MIMLKKSRSLNCCTYHPLFYVNDTIDVRLSYFMKMIKYEIGDIEIYKDKLSIWYEIKLKCHGRQNGSVFFDIEMNYLYLKE